MAERSKRQVFLIRAATALCVLLILLILGWLAAQFLSAPSPVVMNESVQPIYYLHISDDGGDSWQHDVLGAEVLLPGEVAPLPHWPAEAGRLAVKAIDAQGREFLRSGISYDSWQQVRLTEQQVVSGAPGRRELGWFSVYNAAHVPLLYLHVSPVGADRWLDGEQLLPPTRPLLPNERQQVYIDTDEYGTTRYDILAEDGIGNRYVRWDVNIQLQSEVEIRIQDIR
ncbi:hypothetical protein Spiaf_1978 [Spirochaeta africana DSM 8902]|uniref:Uncharacterized protein n=2 Tax=Spirochaeta TaxID=146 RepID=H9UKI6_SPIAZ|nr:hypothetical protein Spiaf_1978 [Spirochaeta africana DSM 8902]